MTPDHTLFLVHGMGKPDDAMFKEWEDLLSRLYGTYAPAGEHFADVFNCIPINYDKLFEAQRDTWSNQINTILTGVSQLPGPTPTKGDLESLTDDNFFTTHIMDVLLYRFAPLVAAQVRDEVVKCILEGIKDGTPPGGKVSIIAYSLGTAVVHDAINVMYNTVSGGTPLLTTDQFRFRAIAQLANVSRTLETKWDAYKPYVRPGVRSSPDGRYCARAMLSASHRWDPLVSLRRFSPDENWPDAHAVAKKRFVLAEPGIIQHWNTHAFEHYVSNPRVHIPLFRYLRTTGFISSAKETASKLTFDAAHPAAQFDAYRQRLKTLIGGEADFSWGRFVEVAKGFAELVKEFTES